MSTEDRLPAEIRVPPTTEPTVEVDAQAHVPPEAAVVALTDGDGPAAPPGESYEALAAAEAAADATPAEMRVPPTPEPTVDVGEGAPVPPEAGIVPGAHRDPSP
ncbi:MAG TPA: hypothetical protein VE463_04350 [Blastococcus sp.]|jgi:hypothetical protein|nr:hypothetical protein [Blastococcus sp.]